ncbi:hypothetical protein [Amycolatopsis sp. La24]|uniref:hypothetical protein n=1 Tax=Amycolatopsis sp. La24 TaxID=3028304 RepID=UPI0023B1A834|nr:hypothetical protein [Amycolatopsis sp. La24]
MRALIIEPQHSNALEVCEVSEPTPAQGELPVRPQQAERDEETTFSDPDLRTTNRIDYATDRPTTGRCPITDFKPEPDPSGR